MARRPHRATVHHRKHRRAANSRTWTMTYRSSPIVKDLDPAELGRPPPAPSRSALDIARGICEKIGNSRPGDLFSKPQPKKDHDGISPYGASSESRPHQPAGRKAR